MSSKSTYFEDAVLNIVRGTDVTAPTNVFLALFTADPTEAGASANHVAPTDYTATNGSLQSNSDKLPEIDFSAPADGTGSERKIVGPDTADIEFENTSGSTITVTHFGIFDGEDGPGTDNMLYSAALDTSKAIANGDSLRFEQSTAITITED